ncbi:MAG: alkene reductase, partial [Proteobacteria bacterium]
MSQLFEPVQILGLNFKNRVVMAPMTRSRAPDAQPNDLMATYYGQRSEAGLIITEGTSPSPHGLGYSRIPGLFNHQHVQGWKKSVDAVHADGGKIFIQLMHAGRVSHPLNMPANSRILAPSAVRLTGTMWTDQKAMQPYPVPQAMTENEVEFAIHEFVQSARLARDAGFDGVEIHGANGYLVEQFLNAASNHRTDRFGGSIENRIRFAVTIAEKMVQAIGRERVGMRISPYGVFNDMTSDSDTDELFKALVQALSKIGIAYIHVVDHESMGAPSVPLKIKQMIRAEFKGTYILSGGYDRARAE